MYQAKIEIDTLTKDVLVENKRNAMQTYSTRLLFNRQLLSALRLLYTHIRSACGHLQTFLLFSFSFILFFIHKDKMYCTCICGMLT